jgi:hypothetical protein
MTSIMLADLTLESPTTKCEYAPLMNISKILKDLNDELAFPKQHVAGVNFEL